METDNVNKSIYERYNVLEQLAEGGFGTVDICWDTKLQRRVAIKRIPLNTKSQEDTLALHGALSEARTASMLTHPNIVSILDFENDDEFAYIIMEYVDGATLTKLLEEDPAGILDRDELAALVESVCAALEFAHENGVLHLDIKPDNILIDHKGNIKIADFGMSRLASIGGYSNALGGTIGYMPPEQMAGGDVDSRADIFGAACVFYEAMTGIRPFSGATPHESAQFINAGVEAPSVLTDQVDHRADDPMLCALDPVADNRIDDIRQLSSELSWGLGSAKVGRRKLAGDVEDFCSDDSYTPPLQDHLYVTRTRGILNHHHPRAGIYMQKFASALIAGPIAGMSVYTWPISSNGDIIAIGIGMLIAVLAAFLPILSVPLLVLLVGSAVIANGSFALGLPVILAGLIWWLMMARSMDSGVHATFLPALLPLGFMGIAPFAIGYLQRPSQAATTGLISVIILVSTLTTLQPGNPEYALLLSAQTWILSIGFFTTAVVVSALCSREKLVLSYLGIIAGSLIQFATICVIAGVENEGIWALPDWRVLAGWAIATIIGILLIVFFGTPGACRNDHYINEVDDK